MQLRFTVFNCGTGYNKNNDDVVAQLFNETHSLKMINDGPGSQSIFYGISKARGMIFGRGVEKNVQRTIDEIKRLNTVDTMVVNMVGWSRGAITCFKTANALNVDPDTQNVKVNIFAIDPVPGNAVGNSYMWKDIGMTANMGMCSTILAQHDRRPDFSPYIPEVFQYDNIDIMPGKHADVVEDTGGNGSREVHHLVKHLAKQFLISRGTVFTDDTVLSDIEILDKYAKLIETYDEYAKKRPFFARKFWRTTSKRQLMNDGRNHNGKMTSKKPPFFINGHHRDTFAKVYPCLANAIDKKSLNPLYNIQRNWAYVKRDMERLEVSPIHQTTFDLVVAYFDLIYV